MADASEEYKAHVEELLAPAKGEIAALRAEMAALKAAQAAPGDADTAETELRCQAAPLHRWRIGRYVITRDHGKWGISDGRKGTGNYRTPIGAWFALRRWQRTPAPPCE